MVTPRRKHRSLVGRHRGGGRRLALRDGDRVDAVADRLLYGDRANSAAPGSGMSTIVPCQVFTTQDSEIMIAAGNDGLFSKLSAAGYQRLVEALADPLFALDVTHSPVIRIVAANTACASFFGVSAEQCVGRLLTETLPAPAALRLTAECDRCKASRG